MGLRRINRERIGGRFRLPSLRGRSHFSKLNKGRGRGFGSVGAGKPDSGGTSISGKRRRKLLPVILIAAVAISVISVEVYVWSSRNAPKTHEANAIMLNQSALLANETALEANETGKLEPAGIDVAIKSLEADDEITVGNNLTMAARVENRGDQNISNITVGFYVGDEAVGKDVIGLLAAGNAVDANFTWSPTDDYEGKQTVRAVADPMDELDEDIETNNEKEKNVEIRRNLIEDVSDEFEQKSVSEFTKYWYSDKFRVPPASGSGYTYFQLSGSGNKYYLDIAIAGFLASRQNNIYNVRVPSASSSGWNGDSCIGESHGGDCIWFGPEIRIGLDFESGYLVARDSDGESSRERSSDHKIKEVRLGGIRVAKWPGEILVFKVLGSPTPDRMVPSEFYEYDNNAVYVYPMKWNPKAKNAEVMTWMRLEIITD